MTGFFSTGQRDGRWWFITPEDERFWSIGLNHIDSAALRFPESGGVWRIDLRVGPSAQAQVFFLQGQDGSGSGDDAGEQVTRAGGKTAPSSVASAPASEARPLAPERPRPSVRVESLTPRPTRRPTPRRTPPAPRRALPI